MRSSNRKRYTYLSFHPPPGPSSEIVSVSIDPLHLVTASWFLIILLVFKNQNKKVLAVVLILRITWKAVALAKDAHYRTKNSWVCLKKTKQLPMEGIL